MFVALILAGLALTCLGIFGWLWLAGGVLRPGWRGLAGALALQLSALGLVYGLIRGQPVAALVYAMFPPLALTEAVNAAAFQPFLIKLALSAAPYAAAMLLISLALKPLRRWSPGLTLATALIAAPILGESISQTVMCSTARAHGFDSFQRNTLLWSLSNTPQEFQFEIHAIAAKDGQSLGFSYRDMDWYVIPQRADVAVNAPLFTCP